MVEDEIIIVNKEKDYTSRDVVHIIGKKFKTKQVGNPGTLDLMDIGRASCREVVCQ